MHLVRDPEVLEELREDPALLAVADAVAATASRRRGRPAARIAVAGSAVAAAVLFLAWTAPWARDGGGFVEQALAAVGDGSVLHAVLRSSNERRIELASGRERPAYVVSDVWRDERAGLIRIVSRRDGVRVGDVTAPLSDGEAAFFDPFAAAARYRELLERGEAHVLGEGVFRGRRVVWLEFDQGDVGRKLGLRWQAAVDPSTYELRGQRLLRGKEVVYSTEVLRLEALPAGSVRIDPDDIGSGDSRSVSGEGVAVGPGAPTLDESIAALPRGTLWLGRRFGTLPLARASASSEKATGGGETANAEVVTLEYGPRWHGVEAAVTIRETRGRPGAGLWRVEGEVAPPEGFMDVSESRIGTGSAGNEPAERTRWTGRLRSRGALVQIGTWRRHDLLKAARALRRIGQRP